MTTYTKTRTWGTISTMLTYECSETDTSYTVKIISVKLTSSNSGGLARAYYWDVGVSVEHHDDDGWNYPIDYSPNTITLPAGTKSKTLTINKTGTISKGHYSGTLTVWAQYDLSAVNGSTEWHDYNNYDHNVKAKTSYTVSYNANGGSSTPSAQTKWYNEALTLAGAISRANSVTNYTLTLNYNGGGSNTAATTTRTVTHSFARWGTSASGGTTYSAGQSYTGNAGLYLYAQWNSSNPAYSSTTLPTPTRAGFAFVRWNTKADNSGTGYAGGSSYTPTSSTTLYAIWNRTVTFDANGGSGAPAAQTAVSTSAITLSGTVPTRSGYTFKRWNTNGSDTGTAYAPGGSYPADAASAKLYAIWNRTVEYDGNGATGGGTAQQEAVSTNATKIAANGFTRTGWAFTGWNTAANGSGSAYQPGASYTGASVKLYAQWKRNVDSVSIGSARAVRVSSASSTTEVADGTYVYATVPYTVSGAAKASVAMTVSASSTGTKPTVTLVSSTATKSADSATLSGTFTFRASGCRADDKITFTITLTATNQSVSQAAVTASQDVVVPAAKFAIDFLAGGTGVSMGSPAKHGGFNVSMRQYAFENVDMPFYLFTTLAVAKASIPADARPCVVLTTSDWHLWHLDSNTSTD